MRLSDNTLFVIANHRRWCGNLNLYRNVREKKNKTKPKKIKKDLGHPVNRESNIIDKTFFFFQRNAFFKFIKGVQLITRYERKQNKEKNNNFHRRGRRGRREKNRQTRFAQTFIIKQVDDRREEIPII